MSTSFLFLHTLNDVRCLESRKVHSWPRGWPQKRTRWKKVIHRLARVLRKRVFCQISRDIHRNNAQMLKTYADERWQGERNTSSNQKALFLMTVPRPSLSQARIFASQSDSELAPFWKKLLAKIHILGIFSIPVLIRATGVDSHVDTMVNMRITLFLFSVRLYSQPRGEMYAPLFLA